MRKPVRTLALLLSLLAPFAGCGGSSPGPAVAGGGTQAPGPGGSPVPPPAPGPGGPVGNALFVNWENLSVHPVDLTPDGNTLCVCNTADHRLELFDVSGDTPVWTASIPVGLDPVSVRVRADGEAWVVNHVSDSVSVVDLGTRSVRATLRTADEPADVVFAGDPARAFVSCSQADEVWRFDPADLAAAPDRIAILGEDPRAMAVSADGGEIYVAIFESGNASTLLGGGADDGGLGGTLGFPPNVVSDPTGPHAGVNPPPNDGAGFQPAINSVNPAAPAVGLIVKRDGGGAWRDDTGADWTALVSGAQAGLSGRPVGWDLPDRDIAVIDSATLQVRYVTGCMNIGAAIGVRPDGRVTLVGTDAINEVRYEPVLKGRFVRVRMALFDPASGATTPARVEDLNPHLDYTEATVAQAERDRSLGDPHGVVWNAAGTRGYVTGMGSNNVVVVDADLVRVGRVEVGEGPTGIALAADGARAYVLNRFEGTVSVVDTGTLAERARVPFFDPTPVVVRLGRRHLYNTRETSGLGQASCGSCHVEGRMDRLAWDLGDPSGDMRAFDQNCFTEIVAPCEDFHPMKGPMTTQTLQDIIGKEPLHWRGDRTGIEEFNGAFVSLLGDDEQLTAAEMQQFEDFLATIRFPPNPFREPDNTLPTSLPLPGHFTPGRFGPAGLPLPDGDAQRGLALYRTASLDGGVPGFQCVTCHTLPTGLGTELQPFTPGAPPPGPFGERHHSLVSVDGSTNVSMKTPHLRNLYDKVGFEATQLESRAGFGFLHDGGVDSLARFVSEPVFTVTSVQQISDLVAFMLAFGGSDLPLGSPATIGELPGPASLDTHAAVGRQVTLAADLDDAELARLLGLATAGAIELVAKGDGRGWWYDRVSGDYVSDRDGERMEVAALRALAAPGAELTWTAVPLGAGRRIGIDRDDDGYGDRTEIDAGSDPADASSVP